MSDLSGIFEDSALGVSRETLEKFAIYKRLLIEYNSKFNLVGPSTLSDIDARHFLDSAQLFPFLNFKDRLVDFGSGAGFPGLVLAMMGCSNLTLIESSHKKCGFLETVSRETNTPVTVWCGRMESYQGERFDGVISRAVASVEKIFCLTQGSVTPSSTYYLLKGERAEEELTLAQGKWSFTCERKKSITHSKGVVLILNHVAKNEKNYQHSKSKRRGWKNNNNG